MKPWSQEDVEKHLAKFKHEKTNNRAAVQAPDVEPIASDESMGKKAPARLDTPVRVYCHTIGRRLGDCDGRSVKAVLDGMVKAGLLAGDSERFVKEVRFTQGYGKEDQTIITIESIANPVAALLEDVPF
jgi:hypothetical protein